MKKRPAVIRVDINGRRKAAKKTQEALEKAAKESKKKPKGD